MWLRFALGELDDVESTLLYIQTHSDLCFRYYEMSSVPCLQNCWFNAVIVEHCPAQPSHQERGCGRRDTVQLQLQLAVCHSRRRVGVRPGGAPERPARTAAHPTPELVIVTLETTPHLNLGASDVLAVRLVEAEICCELEYCKQGSRTSAHDTVAVIVVLPSLLLQPVIALPCQLV